MLQNLRAIRPARLSAIEIAEGALLADIGIVFQLLATYLPVVGGSFALLVPIPFAVLILRRNWYAGIMSFCVALFIIGVLTGPGHVMIMALEAGAGVFLGVTMKYRVRHFLLILSGVTASAILLFSLLNIFQLLSGLSATRMILSLQRNYLSLLAVISFISPYLGLGSWWQHNAYPLLASFAQLILTYWYIFFFAGIWTFLWPIVIMVYLVTNFFVRLLGYDVQPFPGGILEKLLQRILRLIIRLALRLGLGKYRLTQTLIKEVRRRGMQRHEGNGETLHPLSRVDILRESLGNATPVSSRGAPLPDAVWGTVWPVGLGGGRRESGSPMLLPDTLADGAEPAAASSNSHLIDTQHITYTYPHQSQPALQDVSLQIQQGEYVAILGHNGSGKSTLARHCNALLTPTSGRVLVAGLDTSDTAKQRVIREMVGMIFQNPDNQIIATVVEDDVAWALTVRGLPAAFIRERVASAMAAVGIATMGKLAPHQLSGGQRQRLAIAGVLALRPQCIIADEATAQLDPLSRMEIVKLLHQLHQDYGLTIIQVTHFLEEAALAQRVVVMEQGQIVMQGPPAAIFADIERLRRLKLAIPEPIELAARLRNAGLPVSQEALTVEAIAQELVH